MILTFLGINLYDASAGDWHLKCLLDLRSFVVHKLPEDGTLVSKHVRVGVFLWFLFCSN